MSKKKIKMIIVEPSQIVYEGVTSVINNGSYHFDTYYSNNLDDLQQIYLRVKSDLIMINPMVIQNQITDFLSLKKDFSSLKWIGIIYSYVDKQMLTMFDDLVSINDSPQKITKVLVDSIGLSSNIDKTINQQSSLSSREIDVLKLLVDGNSNKEIADRLNISTNTVISHRKNISQKTGIKSVGGLTIYSVANNIVSLDSYLG